MTYSLYCTDPPSRSQRTPDLGQVAPIPAESMGNAITAACVLISRGSIVWQIRGSSGFMMERSDIEAECRRRKNEPDVSPGLSTAA
jgi:hypothetical protein